MEKFAIGIGLLVAAVFVAGSVVDFNIDQGVYFNGNSFADSGTKPPPGAQTLEPGAVRTFAGSELVVQDSAAVLRIIPEARSDIAVSIEGGAQLPAYMAGLDGAKLVLDGELDGRIRGCTTVNGVRGFKIKDVDQVQAAQAPQITVRMPMDAKVSVSGAVDSTIEAAEAVRFGNSGCGEAKIGPVQQKLEINVRGSGDVSAADAGEAEVSIAGSGDVQLATVRGSLKAKVAGSGALMSGDVGGAASLELAGSGETQVGAVAGQLDAKVSGSGDMRIASVTGETDLAIAGSGELVVENGRTPRMNARVAGSGDISFGGVVDGDLTAAVAGSGDVQVKQVTGNVSRSVAGSGDIIIG